MPHKHAIEVEPTLDVEPQSNWVTAITVLSGELDGAKVEIKGELFTIGRERGNSLVLKDNAVSRRHAAIRQDGARYSIRDLGSRWGIKVRGEKVAETDLAFGDEIEIAGIRMRFGQVLKESLSAPPGPSPVRIAIVILLLVTVLAAGVLFYYRYQSQKMFDRPGGDIVSQIIFHYDKGIMYYDQIHIDPDNREKAIEEMKTVIELDPDGKTQFSRSARRIIDGLEN